MKKIVVLMLTCIFLVAGFAGCKKKKDDENTLEIYYTKLGYGDVWLNKLIDIFKEQNPGITVDYWFDEEMTGRAKNTLEMGPKRNSIDLYLTGEYIHSLYQKGANVVAGYDNVFANLTDVYDAKVPGEEVLYKDKMFQSVRQNFAVEEEVDGEWKEQYYLTGFGMGNYVSIIYNHTRFQQYLADTNYTAKFKQLYNRDFQLPKTTDELLEFSDFIKNEIEATPFTIAKGYGYIESANRTWWAQYDSYESYKMFWQGKAKNADGEYEFSETIFDSEGRLNALVIEDKIVNPHTGYNINNALSMDYTISQAKMVNGEAFMQFNGDWFEQEMDLIIKQSPFKYDIRMMALPVVSALSDQLSYWNLSEKYYEASQKPANAQTLKEYDRKLAELTAYVDGETQQKPSWATDDDVQRVHEARNISYGTASPQLLAVPSYSNAIPLAKKFIQLLATDKAQQLITEYGGTTMPFDYDFESDKTLWNKLTPFRQSTISNLLAHDTNYHLPSDLTTMGAWLLGFTYPNGEYSFFNEPGTSDYKAPYTVFTQSKITRGEFNSRLSAAGLR